MIRFRERAAASRFETSARRYLEHREGGGPGSGDEQPAAAGAFAVIDILGGKVPVVPPSARAEEARAAFVASVVEKARAGEIGRVERPRGAQRRLAVSAFARVGYATAALLVVLVFLGGAATSAMPGSPLYGARRRIEQVRLAVTAGNQSRSSLLVSYAGRRVDELEYARKRAMVNWYYPLSKDAQRLLLEAEEEASGLETASREQVLSSAREVAARLEAAMSKTGPALERNLREALEREQEVLRRRLEPGEGGTEDGTRGPSEEPEGITPGQQENRKGEPGTQEGGQQQEGRQGPDGEPGTVEPSGNNSSESPGEKQQVSPPPPGEQQGSPSEEPGGETNGNDPQTVEADPGESQSPGGDDAPLQKNRT